MKNRFYAAVLLIALWALVPAVSSIRLLDHKGEGDIPIIRVLGLQGHHATVTATDSSGMEVTGHSDDAGDVYLPHLQNGLAHFKIEANGYKPSDYNVVLNTDQTYIMNAAPLLESEQPTVSSITIRLPGYSGAISLGKKQQIIVDVEGSNLRGLKPTVWLDCGIASLTNSNQIIPQFSGTGVIKAELGGVIATLEFVVE